MAITSTAAFVEALRSANLLEPPQLSALAPASASKADPRGLARRLLQHGWLTPFQINQLFQGRAPDLVLGPYVLMERLGEGGMGTVYKARHQKLGRVVALKVIRKDRVADNETLRRFRREIDAVAQLSHPNIVTALDAGEEHGTHYFVMEYVAGISLAAQVKRAGPLAVALAGEYLRQAALGLQHVHEHGLVHRDVKPSNLFVTNGGTTLKILDLGLTRLTPEAGPSADDATLTQIGRPIGTPDFMAPEQATNAHLADIRADLYSLGCTLYFVLTGTVPFPGGSPVEKLFRHLGEEPLPAEQLVPELPAGAAAILHRLMAKKPADRYQTPAELATDLATFLTTIDAEFAFDSDAPANRRTPARYLLGAGGLLALVGASLTALVLYGTSSESHDSAATPPASHPQRTYVARTSWTETVLATLKANGLPTLEGGWHVIGPFDNPIHNGHMKGFHHAYPPEKEIDLDKVYSGKKGEPIRWMSLPNFAPGRIVDLRLFKENDAACVYLYREIQITEAVSLPLSLGSDDTLTVWLNGERLLARDGMRRGVAPDQDRVTLELKPGKNRLLLKVCNVNGDWAVYAMPLFPPALDRVFGDSLRRNFPNGRGTTR